MGQGAGCTIMTTLELGFGEMKERRVFKLDMCQSLSSPAVLRNGD